MRIKQLKPKYYVGISGHRDLKQTDIETYQKQIESLLQKMLIENPDKEVIVLSPLADGVDRLIVYAAKKLGLCYEVLLPMPRSLYKKDFDKASAAEFDTLFYEARGWDIVDMCEGCSCKGISEYGLERDRQYREVGWEIVNKSDTIIFLWDGVDNSKSGLGGTADIYNYAKKKNKSHYVIECKREEKKER
jgi:hypothetical protein